MRERWTYPLVIASLLLAGAGAVWLGSESRPVTTAQHGPICPAP